MVIVVNHRVMASDRRIGVWTDLRIALVAYAKNARKDFGTVIPRLASIVGIASLSLLCCEIPPYDQVRQCALSRD